MSLGNAWRAAPAVPGAAAQHTPGDIPPKQTQASSLLPRADPGSFLALQTAGQGRGIGAAHPSHSPGWDPALHGNVTSVLTPHDPSHAGNVPALKS